MVLVGSEAIKYWFPDFHRKPKDTDFIVRDVPMFKEPKTEYLINPVLCDYPLAILDADRLLTLKASHLFWDISWDKHMFDVQFLLKQGCNINLPLFHELYQYWQTTIHINRRSNLTMEADSFFNNALKKYDHDYLHTLINPVPAYTKVLKDGQEVEPDETKFASFSFVDKKALVQEEVMVMAYERLAGRTYTAAYSWMLKKFLMNHAPLWEAIWIIENYTHLHRSPFNYKQKLDNELSRNQRVN